MKVYSSVGTGVPEYLVQEITTYAGHKFFRTRGGDLFWSGWKQIVLKSDLNRHKFIRTSGSTLDDDVKRIFNQLPTDNNIHFCYTAAGSNFIAIVQKFSDHNYGSVLVFGYHYPITQYSCNGGKWKKLVFTMNETLL